MDLQQLVATVALEAGEEVVLDDLHGDRRGALLGRVGGEVGQRGPHEAAHVDPVVGVELLVLDGQEGVDDVLGDLRRGGSAGCSPARTRAISLPKRVVDVGPLGQRLERRQRRPAVSSWALATAHSRGATRDDDRGHQQGPGGHHEPEAGEPGQRAHSATEATWRPPRPGPVTVPSIRSCFRAADCAARREASGSHPSDRPARCLGCGDARPADRPSTRSASASSCPGRPTPRAGSSRPARVEDLGYSTATMPDHFTDQLAPMPALSAAAAVTTTLRIGALVFDNDYKHPVVLAKELATLDVLSGGRVEIGLGAGWMESDYRAAGMPYDRPGVRIDRFEEAHRRHQGGDGRRAVLVRRRALHDHRLRRPAQAGAAAAPADPHRRRRARGCCRSPPARPTSSASTATWRPASSGRTRSPSMTARGRRREGRRSSRDAAGDRIDDIELNIRAFFVSVTDDRAGRPSPTSPGSSASTEAMVAESPFALIGSDGDDRRRAGAPRARSSASATSSSAATTSTPSPPSSPSSPAPDRTPSLSYSRRSFSMTVMPSALTVKRSRSSPASRPTRYHSGHLDVLVDDAAVQPGAGSDAHALEQDRVGDVGVVVDVHAGRDDRALDVGAGDDRPLAQQAAVDVRRLAARAP